MSVRTMSPGPVYPLPFHPLYPETGLGTGQRRKESGKSRDEEERTP